MDPNTLNTIYGVAGVMGTILAVVSLCYAVYTYRKTNKKKKLVYDLSQRQGIATVGKASGDMTISLTVHQQGRPDVRVNGVYAHYLALANIGAEPIRKNDLPNTDPLVLTMSTGRVLSVDVQDVTREAIGFDLERPIEVVDLDGPKHEMLLRIRFEFLGQNDGAVICVITDSPDTKLGIKGTVIDMEDGVLTVGDLNNSSLNRILYSRWVRFLIAAMPVFALALLSFAAIFANNGAAISVVQNKNWALLMLSLVGGVSSSIVHGVLDNKTRKKANPIPQKLRSAYRYSAFTDK